MKFLLIFILVTQTYANEVLLIFCDSSVASKELSNTLKRFSTENDKIYESDSSCVEIFTTKIKEELFTKIMRLKYNNINIQSTTQTAASEKTCKVNIEQTKKQNTQQNNLALGKNGSVSQNNNSGLESDISQVLISNNQSATIQVDSNQYNIKCRIINNDQFEISLSAQSSANSISTSLILSRGSRVEIGNQLRNIDNQSKNIGLPSGIKLNNQVGQIKKSIYLSVQ